jgi:DNA-binding MarR family transcriptional regulator
LNYIPTGKDFFKLTELLFSLNKELSIFLLNELEKQDVNELNYKVVYMIQMLGNLNKKMSVTEFRKKARLEQESVSYYVGLAHSKGYVNIEDKSLDKRVNLISLSEKGLKAYEIMNSIINNEISKVVNIKTSYSILKNIENEILKYCEEEDK